MITEAIKHQLSYVFGVLFKSALAGLLEKKLSISSTITCKNIILEKGLIQADMLDGFFLL